MITFLRGIIDLEQARMQQEEKTTKEIGGFDKLNAQGGGMDL
jgi:hypothetical protein